MNAIQQLKDALPEYAKDTRLNVSSVLGNSTLTPQQLWGTALSVAITCRNSHLLTVIDAQATVELSSSAHTAAKAAASIMAMNNIYYRAKHLINEDVYQSLPARLRMTVIGNPGVEKADFELWCLAVSAITGCGVCLESHEKTLVTTGLSRETVHEALRVAAVLHAVAITMEAENALNPV